MDKIIKEIEGRLERGFIFKRSVPFPKTVNHKDMNTITFNDGDEVFNLVDWQAMLQSEVGISKLRLLQAEKDIRFLLDHVEELQMYLEEAEGEISDILEGEGLI